MTEIWTAWPRRFTIAGHESAIEWRFGVSFVTSARVELLLGSDIGDWVLTAVDPSLISCVVTQTEDIAQHASDLGVRSSERPEGAARALSVHFPRVLSANELGRYERAYNLHPGYLPWGRGTFPLVWAIWLGEPAGATLHRMVANVDAGPIVARRRIRLRQSETAYEVFLRIRAVEYRMFAEWWPRIAAVTELPERPQCGAGSSHSRAEFNRLLDVDPSTLDSVSLQRLRRALAFPGRPGLRADESDARPSVPFNAG
ncbi:hypothetical protein BH23CHL8_BH23CHL8_09520 [soil metagenome]